MFHFGDDQYSDPEQRRIAQRGLLNFAIGMQSQRGFGAGLSAGLERAIGAMDEGANQIENDRYRKSIMERMQASMDRNSQVEAAKRGVLGPDGSLDQARWQQWAAVDAEGAIDFRKKWMGSQPGRRKSPGAVQYFANADGKTEDPYQWDEEAGGWVPASQFVAGSGNSAAWDRAVIKRSPISGGTESLLGDAANNTARAGFDANIQSLLSREGGYVANDAGAGPTNYGINSRANPDVDVANLTPERAADIYRERYWNPIGADNLPPEMQTAAFDAAVNQGPARAKQWLAMAGNDPQKFAALRQQHYDKLGQQDPEKYGAYAEGWRKRNMETAGVPSPRLSQVPAGIPFGRRTKGGDSSAASYTTLTPAEVQAAGLPVGSVVQRSSNGNLDVVYKPDARDGAGAIMPLSAGEAAKVRTNMKETKDALNTFKSFHQALKEVPQGAGVVLSGEQKGRLGTAYNNARSSLRILYNTGVLQPGELPMLEKALKDPTGVQAQLDPRTRPELEAQLTELYRLAEKNIGNLVESYPQLYNKNKFNEVYAAEMSKPTPGKNAKRYMKGQTLSLDGKQYRVVGGSSTDPELVEVR